MDEERVVHEEYKIWKKNCPLLYDVVVTNALVWPSLTCQWLPEKKVLPGSKFAEHKMILGTHTSEGEPNYLMIARINVPLPTAQVTSAKYDDASGEAGNFGASTSKLEITQRIAHEGEINRARYMPQNPFIIATKTPSANVHVFDVSQHPSRPTTDTPRPNMTLRGHEREGYGLSWNPNVPGQLLSGSDDRLICLWNVSQEGGNDGSDPIATFKGHGDVVGDVCWHASNPNMFASVGDDGKLLIWDSRQADATLRCSAHSGQINSVGFNPFSEHLIATAASDKTVALFDIRKIGQLPTFPPPLTPTNKTLL
jgi:histone-binding protein RBBP4